ncbi:conserved hypothetical protein DcmC [Hyphomicrobium sp. GJ21]|nr:conserved hypothetical protein DcmC [Hyphomicrobium sp. GJ21]
MWLTAKAFTMLDGNGTTRWPLAELLQSSTPHPDFGAGALLFGQFVGVWDADVRFIDSDGSVSIDGPGVWSFGWVLDGRVIQDVLTYPRAGSARPGERGIGTTLRRYNPDADTWAVIWCGATSGVLVTLTAKAVDYGIQLDGFAANGTPLRWSFTDIADDRFHWGGYILDQEGSWRLEQEMNVRRRLERPS